MNPATKIPTKRELHAEERRHQLIDVALRLFSNKGYDGTTIKDLAEAGGVAQGLFYHYFQSKEELLLSVFERHGFTAELRSIVHPSADRPASEVLQEVVESHYRLMTENEALVRILVRESITNPVLNERWMATCNEGVRLLAEYLSERVAAGELRPHNTEVSARMLLHPVVMLRMTNGPAVHLKELVTCLLEGIKV
jgi:AcrR family transcriptional regulator